MILKVARNAIVAALLLAQPSRRFAATESAILAAGQHCGLQNLLNIILSSILEKNLPVYVYAGCRLQRRQYRQVNMVFMNCQRYLLHLHQLQALLNLAVIIAIQFPNFHNIVTKQCQQCTMLITIVSQGRKLFYFFNLSCYCSLSLGCAIVAAVYDEIFAWFLHCQTAQGKQL